MDFWNDDNDTTACDICGNDNGDNTGHGGYNEVTQMWSFYLCPVCEAAEAELQAKESIEYQRRMEMSIAMHETMD